jgi:hypothetical protein
VLETVIQKMVTNEQFWRGGLDEGYFTLAPRLESSRSRQIQIKAYASLIMMAIFHGVTPDPISPFLLASVLQGEAAVEDRSFIAAVAPLTAESFSEWPTDASVVPASQRNLSLLCNLNIQV